MSSWTLLQPATLLGACAIGFCLAVVLMSWRQRIDRQAAANEHALLKLVVEHVHEGLVVQDYQGHIEWTNPAYTRITGYQLEEIVGRRPQEFILPDDQQLSPEEIETYQFDLNVFKSGTEERILNRRKNGELFWNELTFAVLEGRSIKDTKVVVISRDVTRQIEHLNELEEARKSLKYKAEHDDLTNVANRTRLNSYLDRHLSKMRVDSGSIAVLHLDLDQFKHINDEHGHAAGDAVLVHVADVLQECVADLGLVARVGGDEFVVVVPEPEDMRAMTVLAEEILKNLAVPIKSEQVILTSSGSIGLTITSDRGVSASELINLADIALYEAKRRGGAQLAWYAPELGRAYRRKWRSAGQSS